MKEIDLHLTCDETEKIVHEGIRHVYRTAPGGRAWDTFHTNGRRFEIIDVSERSAGTTASTYYRLEGCATPEDYIRGWKESHGGHWEPDQILYIHWFRDISSPKEDDLI